MEGSSGDLYSKVVDDPEVWEDADVDLSRYGGRTVKLVFRTDAERTGTVGALGESFADELCAEEAPKRSYLYDRYAAG